MFNILHDCCFCLRWWWKSVRALRLTMSSRRRHSLRGAGSNRDTPAGYLTVQCQTAALYWGDSILPADRRDLSTRSSLLLTDLLCSQVRELSCPLFLSLPPPSSLNLTGAAGWGLWSRWDWMVAAARTRSGPVGRSGRVTREPSPKGAAGHRNSPVSPPHRHKNPPVFTPTPTAQRLNLRTWVKGSVWRSASGESLSVREMWREYLKSRVVKVFLVGFRFFLILQK